MLMPVSLPVPFQLTHACFVCEIPFPEPVCPENVQRRRDWTICNESCACAGEKNARSPRVNTVSDHRLSSSLKLICASVAKNSHVVDVNPVGDKGNSCGTGENPIDSRR